MMKTSSKTMLAAAVLAGLTFGATAARADLLVEYSVNGGAYTVAYSGSPSNGIANFPSSSPTPGLAVTNGSVSTNSPGQSTFGAVNSVVLSLANTSGSQLTFSVIIASSGFTMPQSVSTLTGSVTIQSNGGGTAGSTVSEYATAFANNGSATTTVPAGATKTNTANATDPGLGHQDSENNNTVATNFAPNYEILTMASTVIPNGADIKITTSADVFGGPTAVPEPASLAVLGTGLLGLGLIRRRRRNG